MLFSIILRLYHNVALDNTNIVLTDIEMFTIIVTTHLKTVSSLFYLVDISIHYDFF